MLTQARLLVAIAVLAVSAALVVAGCAYAPSTGGATRNGVYQVCLPDTQERPLEIRSRIGPGYNAGQTVPPNRSSVWKTEKGQAVLEGEIYYNADRLLVRMAPETPGGQPRVFTFRIVPTLRSGWTGWATPLDVGYGEFPRAMAEYEAYRPLQRAELAKAPRMRWLSELSGESAARHAQQNRIPAC